MRKSVRDGSLPDADARAQDGGSVNTETVAMAGRGRADGPSVDGATAGIPRRPGRPRHSPETTRRASMTPGWSSGHDMGTTPRSPSWSVVTSGS